MLTSAHCTAGRCGHRPLRASKYRKAFRISYVKYSTGANITTNTAYPAMRKPDSTVARRAFLDRRCYDNTHNVAKCFFARKRYFASPSTLFSTIFSLAREKMVPPEAQLRRHRKSGTAVRSRKRPRTQYAKDLWILFLFRQILFPEI